ncbi:MAG: hypothetical protein ACRYG8_01080 [Janthinobacterium lividum]
MSFCSRAALNRAVTRLNALFAAPRDRLSSGTKLELGVQMILTGLYEAAPDDHDALVKSIVARLVERPPERPAQPLLH